MAEVLPFKGVRYNAEIIEDMSEVVAPPYDVIPESQQTALHERHPKNVVRLILGQNIKGDTPDNNRHTRAACYFQQWWEEKTLIRDDEPAFYVTAVEFTVDGKMITRYGLIALVGLEPFDKGIILPHEKTFSKVKSERLELMKVCHANFSPIFALYKDADNIFATLLTTVSSTPPEIDILDDKNERHQFWRITDPAILRKISESMQSQRLFIADGHHRYETALNYRQWVSENTPDFDKDHPANFILMYLCSMEDPGLVILPAHRLLKQVDDSELNSFIDKAKTYFEIASIPFNGKPGVELLSDLLNDMDRHRTDNTIGVYIKKHPCFYRLSLKPGVMQDLFADELDASLRDLDVTVLTRLIFMEMLGFDQNRLDDASLIAYSSVAQAAIQSIDDGECDIAFLLNSTDIEQVKKVAEKRLVMPRKATYFYPKVLTGLVFNSLKK